MELLFKSAKPPLRAFCSFAASSHAFFRIRSSSQNTRQSTKLSSFFHSGQAALPLPNFLFCEFPRFAAASKCPFSFGIRQKPQHLFRTRQGGMLRSFLHFFWVSSRFQRFFLPFFPLFVIWGLTRGGWKVIQKPDRIADWFIIADFLVAVIF